MGGGNPELTAPCVLADDISTLQRRVVVDLSLNFKKSPQFYPFHKWFPNAVKTLNLQSTGQRDDFWSSR